MVFARARHGLAHERIAHTALDPHHDRLLHLVAGDPADQRALVLLRGRRIAGHSLFAHLGAFSLMMVRTRAMSRFTFFNWLVLPSCWVATCMRRPNWARSSPSSSFCSSSPFLPRSSLGFIVDPSLFRFVSVSAQHALDHDGAERQLRRGKRERLLGEHLGHAVHLEQHLARLDLGYEVFGIALAVAHADLGGLLRDRLVRE